MGKQVAGAAIIVIGGFAVGAYRTSTTDENASVGEVVQGGVAVALIFLVVLGILLLLDRARQNP